MPITTVNKELSSIDGLKYIPSHYLQSSPSSSHAHTNSHEKYKNDKFFNMQHIDIDYNYGKNGNKKQAFQKNKKKTAKNPLKNEHIVS